MPNRLADEASPYLRQHAHNPVDWYPWGDEALALARESNRPILLSIGYSSCHWCHVMERESFDDPAVAAEMNRAFVNVKVDREERPDVDSLYMRAVQSMTGHGGWPLTVFLTPGGAPFYGGTYFPPEPRHGMPSFRQVLQGVERAWREEGPRVLEHAEELRGALERSMRPPPPSGEGHPREDPARGTPTLEEIPEGAARTLLASFDPAHGGFGRAPKFPQPVVLDFLLLHHFRTGNDMARHAVLTTLERMAQGGIRDHLGGGFHRYSVDARWLVPHFEKMLYDNALLLGTYLDAWRLTSGELYREVAVEIGEYVLEDLRDPGGGFLSARDADSEGEEGLFYVWTPQEVEAVLGKEEGALFCRAYDVRPGGNFEGRSILNLPRELDAVAREEGMTGAELHRRLERSRVRLLEVRGSREEPYRDEKVLTGWNGLLIRTLARGARILGRDHWLEAAVRAAEFLLEHHRRPDGTLLRTSVDGAARIPAFLEDYGALGLACLTLHEATLDPEWLDAALALAEAIPARFLDPESGLLFDAAGPAEAGGGAEAGGEASGEGPLLVRPRDPSDNAVPSGTSLALELLTRLGLALDRPEWVERTRHHLEAEARGLLRFPAGFGRLLQVLDLVLHPAEHLVVAPGAGGEAMVRAAFQNYRPALTLLAGEPAVSRGICGGKPPLEGAATAYLCRDYTCEAPTTRPRALAALLAHPPGLAAP